jgi:hypothetical protein
MKLTVAAFMFAFAATAFAGDLSSSSPCDATHIDPRSWSLAMRGRGPASYQDLVRRTMVKFVDPERRIRIPPSHPGVGW